MWDNIVTHFKAVFFQGWFWVDKAEESKTGLTLIIILIVLVVIVFGLVKVGFFKKSK